MNTVTLDGAKLKAIAHKSHTAIVTATSLALRERLRHSSDITRTRSELARQGEKIVESDYMQFWKDLQTAGVGSIIYGRKGKPDRFDWHYSLKSIAKACIDGQDVKATKNQEIKAEPAKAQKEVKPDSSKSVQSVYVPLRNDFGVEIKVPSKMTKAEVEILTKALMCVAV